MHFLKSSTDRERRAVFVSALSRLVSVNVGVRIDPYDVHVLVLLVGGHHRRAGDAMVTTNNKGEMKPSASVVQTLVALLCFELSVLQFVSLRFTHILHEVVVNVIGSLIHSEAFLTLAASRKHWLEFS